MINEQTKENIFTCKELLFCKGCTRAAVLRTLIKPHKGLKGRETFAQGCFKKKLFCRILQNSQERNCDEAYF